MSLFDPPDIEKLLSENDFDGVINALKHQDNDLRRQAIEALGKLKDAGAITPLLPLLLAGTSNEQAMEIFTTLMEVGEDDIRREVIWTLQSMNGEKATDILIQALNDRSKDMRTCAAMAFTGRQDPKAIPALREKLFDDDEFIRNQAAEALKNQGWQPGEDEEAAMYWLALGWGLNQDQECWDKCLAIGTPSIKPLILMLSTSKGDQAKKILDQLNWKPDRGETGAAYYLASGNWEECVSIGKPALDVLLRALKNGSIPAAKALGELGDARAVKILNDKIAQYITAFCSESYIPSNDHRERELRETIIALAPIGDSISSDGLDKIANSITRMWNDTRTSRIQTSKMEYGYDTESSQESSLDWLESAFREAKESIGKNSDIQKEG